jgi:hypothetical protein
MPNTWCPICSLVVSCGCWVADSGSAQLLKPAIPDARGTRRTRNVSVPHHNHPKRESHSRCTLTSRQIGTIRPAILVLFLVFGHAFATLISVGSVLLEEMTYRR